MKIIKVDPEICIDCGQCAEVCPAHLYQRLPTNLKEKSHQIEFLDPLEGCIQCGHCFAICPVDAIQYQLDREEIVDSISENFPTASSVNLLLRTRRSIREFTSKPLTKEEIQALLDTMRYAPSASNAQNWRYLVISDPKLIQEFSKKVVNSIQLTRLLVKSRIIPWLFIHGQLRKKILHPFFLQELTEIIQRTQRGDDPIFFHAPCLIVLYSPNYGNLAGCDSGIALTYGMLAAQARGLGTCWIGAAQEALQRLPGFRKWLGIPQHHLPQGILAIGYSKYTYKKVPPRKALYIDWKE
jgi:nitroreductase/NAD-dependent dihydropyrimidine dehydrogenase PreA subunit